MIACRVCRHAVQTLLDFGPQPVCNRYLTEPSATELRHPLRLGQCPACGLMQLVEPLPATLLKPPRPMLYNEPEWHLDQVVNHIAALPGVNRDAGICGLTYKEASLIARLQQRGYRHATVLDARADLGVLDPAAGIGTIQQQISQGVLTRSAAHHGRYQVVIARHTLEHAHDLQAYVAGLRGLLASGGYLIFEIPDFTASVCKGNYATIWEEHVVYFTKATFPAALQRLGSDVREILTYPSALEDLLVGVTRVAGPRHGPRAWDVDVAAELSRGRRYAAMRLGIRTAWEGVLGGERAAGRQVALLGAGHLAIMFINLLGLGSVIDLVVDDDPAKKGWYLPGSRLPVDPSRVLYERNVRLCLMSVAPESESKVLVRHQRFLESGGRFVSIFPDSGLGLALPLDGV